MKERRKRSPFPCARCSATAGYNDLTRRGFLARCGGLAAAAGAGMGLTGFKPILEDAPRKEGRKVRVGLVSVCAPPGWNVWPYVNFDYASRKQEIHRSLENACPDIEFVPLTVQGNPDEEIGKTKELAAKVDGLLVFLLCTNWGLTHRLLPAIGELHKPAVFVDEPYAGSGVFLCHGARVLRQGARVVMLSTCRFRDVVDVVHCFELLGKPGASFEGFVAEAERVRKANFARPGDALCECKADPVKAAEVSEVIERLQGSKILRVVGKRGDPYKALGATVEPVSFDEINAAYKKVDPEEAAMWADRWIKEAAEVVEPSREEIQNAGSVYLAMNDLMAARGASAITMDCLGGFYSGKLPGYPCLGYRQLNDDGVMVGTCEAQLPDILAMMICRYMFDRASFASDPVLDTSTNQIIYAHCVAPTRMLGPGSPANPFKIRSHAEDNKGASIQSLLPVGYMTTSFRTTWNYKQLAIHQAKAVANVDEPKACRTKLAAEVKGDIGRLFLEWDRFSWHRLTVYGDVMEEIEELAKALEMEVIHEA